MREELGEIEGESVRTQYRECQTEESVKSELVTNQWRESAGEKSVESVCHAL